jgi:uncharacterized Fe-S cluster-containing radical SAM superfamily protein
MDNVGLPRHVGSKAYDREKFLSTIENSVCAGSSRLYAGVSLSPNFGGSIKAYAVGCELRCGFCWSPVRTVGEVRRTQSNRASLSRSAIEALADSISPGDSASKKERVNNALAEIAPRLFSPTEIVDRMIEVANSRVIEGIGLFELCTEGPIPQNIYYYTISGGEPTACRQHLVEVLEVFEKRKIGSKFLLQTHGFILGSDPSYLQELVRFRDFLEVRISLKAATVDGLTKRTGLSGTSLELPFRAIQQLLDLDFDFYLAAMSDPLVMPDAERQVLLSKLDRMCRTAGRTLCPFTDITPELSLRELGGEVNDYVFLEEEPYVPVFPELLASNRI